MEQILDNLKEVKDISYNECSSIIQAVYHDGRYEEYQNKSVSEFRKLYNTWQSSFVYYVTYS